MEVIIIMGNPASGKSTITKEFIVKRYANLNRETEGGSIAGLLLKLEDYIKNDTNVVLDNLFPTVEIRKPFIDLAKKYNINVTCKLMDTSIEDSQFNFIQRMINITGKILSPEELKKSKHPNVFPPTVFFKYRKEFQKPTLVEGFDKIDIINFIRNDDVLFTNKAVITDYDGSVRDCINGNGKYPIEESNIKIKEKVKETLQSYSEKGYFILGISNQSGVDKGELSYDKAVQLFNFTNKLIGLDIDFLFCPHQSAPISCYCRKPQIGLFINFMMKYKLSRRDTIYVGDMTTDATMAKRAGIQYIDHAEFYK